MNLSDENTPLYCDPLLKFNIKCPYCKQEVYLINCEKMDTYKDDMIDAYRKRLNHVIEENIRLRKALTGD